MTGASVRLSLAGLCLILALLLVGFGPPTLIESESAVTPVSSATLKQMRADRQPQVSAKAAVLIDVASGMVLYEKNAHARRAPASTTKMMTALVTLERTKLDEVVRAGPNVKVEPTVIGLDPGDELTVEQMLYGMMLPSGNDASIALAEHVGGSMPRFATMMNAKASELGMKDTNFVNPNGLDTEGHYSSAYDLALLARVGLRNPVFARIVATKEYRIEGPLRWYFKNNNQLLNSFLGADGVKTGYTDNAGRCLVSSATRDGRRTIAVVLDSSDPYWDSAALLDYYFRSSTTETLSAAELPLGSYAQGGEVHRTTAKSPTVVAFPKWQKPYLRWFYSVAAVTSRQEGAAGTVSYYLFGKKMSEMQLYDEGG